MDFGAEPVVGVTLGAGCQSVGAMHRSTGISAAVTGGTGICSLRSWKGATRCSLAGIILLVLSSNTQVIPATASGCRPVDHQDRRCISCTESIM